jgi:hypothetical protein
MCTDRVGALAMKRRRQSVPSYSHASFTADAGIMLSDPPNITTRCRALSYAMAWNIRFVGLVLGATFVHSTFVLGAIAFRTGRRLRYRI